MTAPTPALENTPSTITCTSRFDGSVQHHLLDETLLNHLATINGSPTEQIRQWLLEGKKIWTDFNIYEIANPPAPPDPPDPPDPPAPPAETTQDAAARIKADIKHIAEQFLDRVHSDDFADDSDPDNIGPLEAIRDTMIDAYSDAFGVDQEFVTGILEELDS